MLNFVDRMGNIELGEKWYLFLMVGKQLFEMRSNCYRYIFSTSIFGIVGSWMTILMKNINSYSNENMSIEFVLSIFKWIERRNESRWSSWWNFRNWSLIWMMNGRILTFGKKNIWRESCSFRFWLVEIDYLPSIISVEVFLWRFSFLFLGFSSN